MPHPLAPRVVLPLMGVLYLLGFLNIFLAAALLRAGHSAASVAPVLEERDPNALAFTAHGITWRDLSVTTAQLAAARTVLAASFGSCSFPWSSMACARRPSGPRALDTGPQSAPRASNSRDEWPALARCRKLASGSCRSPIERAGAP